VSLHYLEKEKIIEVCVVGRYWSEPEIQILRDMGYLVKATTFGIDHSDHFLDFNVISAYDSDIHFDLILSSLALEHIWNHASAFANISDIAKSKSLLWVSCPTSNRFHGSPDYYSAGFMPEYLEKNLVSPFYRAVRLDL
jgi:SAM-dependent methyltransferase